MTKDEKTQQSGCGGLSFSVVRSRVRVGYIKLPQRGLFDLLALLRYELLTTEPLSDLLRWLSRTPCIICALGVAVKQRWCCLYYVDGINMEVRWVRVTLSAAGDHPAVPRHTETAVAYDRCTSRVRITNIPVIYDALKNDTSSDISADIEGASINQEAPVPTPKTLPYVSEHTHRQFAVSFLI